MTTQHMWTVIFLVLAIVSVLNIILHLRMRHIPRENSNIKAGLKGHEAGVTIATDFPECRVSYVMYAPRQSKNKAHQMCIANADIFLSRGVVSSPRVDYVFNLVGNTPVTSKISAAARSMSNVKISRVPDQGVDLLAHLHTMKSSDRRYEYYIFLNCEARGPYFSHSSGKRPLKPSLAWISRFTDQLRSGASAVGSTISPELSYHIQTYAMALNYQAAKFAVSYSDRFNGSTFTGNATNKSHLIANWKVGLSSALIEGGFSIASLDTRMQGVYSMKANLAGDIYDDPIACRTNHVKTSSGCEGVEPCEVIFVMNGGEVLTEGLVPKVTIDKFSREDKISVAKKPHMCDRMIDRYCPSWDVPSIFKNISDPTDEGNWIAVDLKSDLAIIVRVHASYSHKLITLLWMLESSAADQFKQVRVIVVPTDQQSIFVLRNTLEEHWNRQTNGSISAKRIRITVMEYPTWLYEKYGSYLQFLCSRDYIAKATAIYGAYAASRYCDVNSPLHYLLCDLTLHYITTSLTSCKWVITTNADNYYTPGFFVQLAKTNVSEHDIMMSNMLTKGNILETKPAVGGVDLGAYAVSLRFMKALNASFLNSLPRRCGPQQYHNADGHFIEFLVLNKARIKNTKGFLFIHN